MMPALLNAMSSRPNVATVRSTAAATWSSSATSQTTREHPVTVADEFVGRGAQRLLVDVGEHDGGAVLSERAGGAEPHAGAGAGDEARPGR